MSEEKKIKIKKNFNHTKVSENKEYLNKVKVIDEDKVIKSLELLEKTVNKIENKYKVFGFYDSKEEEFYQNTKGKEIAIEMNNGIKIKGKLEAIDKFRICLNTDNIKKYYFKHSILCYYAS